MCGRFAQTNLINLTGEIVKTVIGNVEKIDNYNISPGQEAAVIKKFTNGRALEMLTWSIIPSWSKSIENFKPLHNTRVESLTKPYFKKISSKNRLLVPATFYYEWAKEQDNSKTPYCFSLREKSIIFIGGIFDGSQFSILTKEAEPENKSIHHRQPLIINKSKINDFLNVKNDILDVLDSVKPPSLEYWKISKEINNPKNNSENLIKSLK